MLRVGRCVTWDPLSVALLGGGHYFQTRQFQLCFRGRRLVPPGWASCKAANLLRRAKIDAEAVPLRCSPAAVLTSQRRRFLNPATCQAAGCCRSCLAKTHSTHRHTPATVACKQVVADWPKRPRHKPDYGTKIIYHEGSFPQQANTH